MSADDRRARASESLATHFTRTMNAATSPYGVLADLTLASAAAAIPVVLVVRQAAAGDLASPLTLVIACVALVPIASAIGVSLALRSSRERVVEWLAAQPFPIDNLNSLLVGLSDELEIVFAEGAKIPSRVELQKLLDAVSDDALALDVLPEERTAIAKLGVVESKRLPLRSTYLRYERLKRIVGEVLVPLSERASIVSVRLR